MSKAREKAEVLWQSIKDQYTPEYVKASDFELGIDEAGRGPVFGSMIYSALWWPIQLKEQLGALGFNDSKALTEDQRERLLEAIDVLRGKIIFYATKDLTAEYISTSMNNQHDHVNLNEMSHRSALQLTRDALKEGFRISHVYADTVGDPQYYTKYLRNRLEDYADIVKNITVQAKADRDHKVVSAASICAKVTRDKILKNWHFRQNIEFKGELGSGYPGDPKTKEWLQKNKDPVFGYPDMIRFSWNTSINALQGTLKIKLFEKEEEQTLTGFALFSPSSQLHRDLWDVIGH